ncbi:hypothetical protein O1L60_37935 [Streptomyces diastatochromogenes]|nr:hypothetical protein [Streptomyces diastatochromogenes]
MLIVSVGDVEDQRSVIGLDAATGKVRWRQPRALTFPEAGAGASPSCPTPWAGARSACSSSTRRPGRSGRVRASSRG